MGIWTRKMPVRSESGRPLTIARKINRFQRLVKQHGELLDLISDLRDKQSEEYILDRRYIEAQLDRAHELARQVLYDMHVISESSNGEGYDELDRLRFVSEEILRKSAKGAAKPAIVTETEEHDWEIGALKALHAHLAHIETEDAAFETMVQPGREPPGRSLAGWVEWAHGEAAGWITENLASLWSPAPLVLWDPEGKRFWVEVFPLAGDEGAVRVLGAVLSRVCLACAEPPGLLPFRYFMEGFARSLPESEASNLRVEEKKGAPAEGSPPRLHLYVGEAFLLLVLPRFLPLRLFWVSLSVEPDENRFYLFGSSASWPGDSPERFTPVADPFPTYRCKASPKRWFTWGSRFSWAQGEERIRVLAALLVQSLEDAAGGAKKTQIGKGMQQGLSGLLGEHLR